MNRLASLFGAISFAAVNYTPAFAGTYSVSSPSYKIVSATPANAAASLPEGVPPQGKADTHEDPMPKDGNRQDFKYLQSTIALKWVASVKGEVAPPCPMKHSYNVKANMTSYRNGIFAFASAFGDTIPRPTNDNFHSFKSGGDPNSDEPNLAFDQAGETSLGNYTATYSGQRITVTATIGAKATTDVAVVPGGTASASARTECKTTKIAIDTPNP